MIEVRALTKRFGTKVAVDDLTFDVAPGRVTGFLGPNGAGKSTTMRLILGLDRADGGTATIDGRAYRDLPDPLRHVGALLEARSVHTGRSARNHLLFLAQTQGLPARRVDEMLELVGLTDVASKRAGGFSLGMGQRLGIAAALLGDPQVLLLDEPVNGLDPEGVLWIRNLMKHLAGQGRTILVSSHLMNEMAVTADHLIVIGRGRLHRGLEHERGDLPGHREVGPRPHARPGPAGRPDRGRRRHRDQGRGPGRAVRRPERAAASWPGGCWPGGCWPGRRWPGRRWPAGGRTADRDRPGGAQDRRAGRVRFRRPA